MDERAITLLRRRGWVPGKVLGSGMEGTVVEVSAVEVAKIWHERPPAELGSLLRFGKSLAHSSIPFRCSRVVDAFEEDGHVITIEEKVPGEPLRRDELPDPPVVTDSEARLMGDALAGLSQAVADGLDALPVLPNRSPFSKRHEFGSSLAGLVEQQFQAHSEPLCREVVDAEEVVDALVHRLRMLADPHAKTLIHGDLIPANVLVADGDVAGVVDFGYLTTVGDPQFDAAIAASVFDMYGPNARASESTLSKEFSARFDHDPSKYGLYRAAYAVITNTLYSADGQDGHFAWCVSILKRSDVRDAIAGH